ncbi:putative receptor-like protein kinase [Carex littledalei]|uniref:non-specific serine/threonine protein kinase n=1 Tax=Carex littledalei TaxID=544730 RepID=A0A833QKJ2_9POAL|nr:putative receptor-like protein kinase [Carex littledalei]
MGCLNFWKKKSKTPSEKKQTPPSTNTSNQVSHTSTSRSDDSGTGLRPVSKSSGSTSSQRSIPAMYEERAHNLRVFELDELRGATNDFNRALKIGEGGFGSVYKGYIKPLDGKGDRIVVAVKQLNQRGLQGHKEWLAEVQFLGVLEHPNLVKLIGYCADDGARGNQRLLVYEYMPNRSLEDHLFNRAYPPLSWNQRLQIMLGAAEGLAYLHEGIEIQVIYRDFKASNVLLDRELKPKLSDFGLAREGPTGSNTHVSTAAVGTYGYAAPDYIETGHLTTKSDVWSFGVVLYEFLTGRRSLERNRPSGEQKLLEWVRQYPPDKKSFRMIIDPKLQSYSLKAAVEIAKLAASCLAKNPKERPKMSEVVERLRRVAEMDPIVDHPSGDNLETGRKGGARAMPSASRTRRRY